MGGELVMALAEATGAAGHPRRLRALRAAPAGGGRAPRDGRQAGAHRLRRPVPRPHGDDLEDVTVEEALAHPTWEMGGKITIDSATLMNKGLEVIEAHHLFGMPYDQIDVVVHPQSIVHALVTSTTAPRWRTSGYPDMRVPISYALHHPERADVPVRAARPGGAWARSTSRRPTRTPSRACAWPARPRMAGGTAPCVLNAATRSPCTPSCDGELPFTGIPRVIEDTLRAVPAQPLRHFSRPRPRPTPRPAAIARAEPRYDLPARRSCGFGFMALVVLHELGHFFAAKAVGMRVEKFSLFFPPNLISRTSAGRPSTRIGAIPARGLREDHRDEPRARTSPRRSATRAYHSQPVWKRIVVIAAGPAVNLVVALPADVRVLLRRSAPRPSPRSRGRRGREDLPGGGPAAPGDKIIAVDGKRGESRTPVASRSPRTGAPARRPSPLQGHRAGRAVLIRAQRRRRDASSSRRSTTPQAKNAPGWASATRPARARRCRSGKALDAHVRPVQLHHGPDPEPARPPVRRREAQGDLGGRGLLRGHAADDPPATSPRWWRSWRSSRSRWRS